MDVQDRVESALWQLVTGYLPALPNENEAETEMRQDDVLDRVQDIIDSHPRSDTVMDMQHLGDIIKKKLIRDHPTPEPASRFNTLYTRLLAQPVLSQKWGVLKFILELSGTEDEPVAAPETVPPPVTAAMPDGEQVEEEVVFSKAFSSQGLHRLPMRNSLRNSGHFTRSKGTEVERPKAALLKEEDPNEHALLSALPFTLIGLSSSELPFKTSETGQFSISIPAMLSLPLVSVLNSLAEPSLLYKSLNEITQSSPEGQAGGGLVGQSLRAAIGLELRGWVNLISGLESEIRRANSSAIAGESASDSAEVTLKRSLVWIQDAIMGLRLMSLIMEKTKGLKGGQLISTIHYLASSHGDPYVHQFAERLLSHTTRPFYEMLRHWIYEGELSDPYLEFFVTEEAPRPSPPEENKGKPKSQAEVAAAIAAAKPGATSVWQDKYHFHAAQVPSIITEEFARKVFLIGKSLNFIRHGCSDSDWVESYSKSTSKELRYGDTAKLEMNIDEAYKTTMARLIDLMGNKFKLFDHLVALKKFLLLGQGDFIALLMESLSANLDRPANTLYRHNLTAQLEHAIRGSNAQFENPHMLARLDARMLELSHGEVGWDVFTLEYKIEAPVDVVVTTYGSKQYLKVFNFLWRIKRVEHALGTCWRKSMTGSRGVLKAVDDIVGTDWKKSRCVVAEMVHFVNQLQYYILFEVIESSWDALQTAIKKPNVTLDDLIEAHSTYLQQITHKGLLGGTSVRSGMKRSASQSNEESFLSQLHEILKIMLQYKDAVDGLYGYSVAEFTRRQERGARIEARTEKGGWGIQEAEDETSIYEDQTLPNLQHRLKELASDFSARVVTLLGDLAYQPDADLRLLGVLLTFNDFYPVIHKRRTRERVTESGTARRGRVKAGNEKEKPNEKGNAMGKESRNVLDDASTVTSFGTTNTGGANTATTTTTTNTHPSSLSSFGPSNTQ